MNDLKAEHAPSATPVGKRMAVTAGPSGRPDAFVYPSAPIQDDEVIRILAKYGVTASMGIENAPRRSDTRDFEA